MSDFGFSLFEGEEVTLTHTETILPNSRLFNAVADFLVILSSITYAASYFIDFSIREQSQPGFIINSPLTRTALVVPLQGPFEFALEAKTPDLIEIGILPEQKQTKNQKLFTQGFDQILHHVIAPIYLMFFDRYNEWLTQTLGDAVNWPATLNFARVVRNAIAHGKINIRNPATAPASWKGLSYGYPENGQVIIGNDLRVGDILVLMLEIDDELDRISAPIL